MPFREVTDIQLDSADNSSAPRFREVQDIKLDNPDDAQTEGYGRTALDQSLQGATFGFADEVSDRVGALIASKVTGESYDSLLEEARAASQARMKRQFEQNPKTAIASNITGALLTGAAGTSTKAGTAIANSVRSGNAASRIVKGAVAGAASGGLYGAGTAEDGKRLEGAGEGAAFGGAVGGAIPAVGAAASAVKDAIVPVVDDALKPLAKRARDFGISLRADQVAPTKVRNTVQKVSQELPFSGVDKFEATQRGQWNKALASTIGEDALAPDSINNFISRNSDDFGSVLAGKKISVNKSVLDSLEKVKLKKSADAKQAIGEYIDDIVNNVQGGKISGENLNSVRSSFIRDLSKKSGDIKNGLSEILDKVDDIIDSALSDKEQATLGIARRQYRNFKTIEPLLEKSTDGEINPTQLLQRVASSKYIKASRKSVGEDDLVDLARIGKEFLPKKGGSDTFQKTALVGAGGLGTLAVTNPLLALQAAATTGGALAANRGFQAVNSSQRLIDAGLRAGAKTAPKITNIPVNALIAAEEAARK